MGVSTVEAHRSCVYRELSVRSADLAIRLVGSPNPRGITGCDGLTGWGLDERDSARALVDVDRASVVHDRQRSRAGG
jgi:hypothetical protein